MGYAGDEIGDRKVKRGLGALSRQEGVKGSSSKSGSARIEISSLLSRRGRVWESIRLKKKNLVIGVK